MLCAWNIDTLSGIYFMHRYGYISQFFYSNSCIMFILVWIATRSFTPKKKRYIEIVIRKAIRLCVVEYIHRDRCVNGKDKLSSSYLAHMRRKLYVKSHKYVVYIFVLLSIMFSLSRWRHIAICMVVLLNANGDSFENNLPKSDTKACNVLMEISSGALNVEGRVGCH